MEAAAFMDGLPINSMVIFHGHVSHNQRVIILIIPHIKSGHNDNHYNPPMVIIKSNGDFIRISWFYWDLQIDFLGFNGDLLLRFHDF